MGREQPSAKAAPPSLKCLEGGVTVACSRGTLIFYRVLLFKI